MDICGKVARATLPSLVDWSMVIGLQSKVGNVFRVWCSVFRLCVEEVEGGVISLGKGSVLGDYVLRIKVPVSAPLHVARFIVLVSSY